MHKVARFAMTILLAGSGLAVGVALLAPQVRAFVTAGVAGPSQKIDLQPLATRSVVYARDGSELATLHAEENRLPVPLDQVPAHVVTAVLDAEDERYWEHGPLDLRAMTRALVENVETGAVTQGGSTITQQLVKTAILTPRRDVNRKVQEAALAVRLESQMSKVEILERYLNTVYFGNGVYGVQAAAEKYFGTDAQKLDLGQGILLASLIRNPVGADPWVYPEEAIGRRNVVIDRMLQLGHVSPEQAESLKGQPLPQPPPERPAQGSDYFTEHVKQLLLADERLGATVQDRIRAVFKGGLAIRTTLDPNLQRLAEEKIAEVVPDTDGLYAAALVSVEPQTGAVRALVGGRGFEQSKFNLVTDGLGRQTGSAFKTFTLQAALEAGYLPGDTIMGNSPCKIPNPGSIDDPWEAKNAEGGGAGTMTLTEATVHSVNCAYARLVKLVGPQKVVDVAQRMGVTNGLAPNLSITLGSGDTTPLQMAAAYATLAAEGERRSPYFIESVEDRTGKAVIKADVKVERAISVQHARTVNQILTQVVQRGTGTAAAIPGWFNGVAGKTGSTDFNLNAWFVGYTPELSTAVWMGSPGLVQREMSNVGGVRVYGGTYPAMVFGAYMRAATAGRAPLRFTPPDPMISRPPRLLTIPGEQPVVERVVPEFDDAPTSSTAATTVVPAGPATSTTVPGGGRLTTLPPFFEDPWSTIDDTPRTTRTSRVRPRDLTTIAPP